MSSSPQPGIRPLRKRVAFDDSGPMLPRLEEPNIDDNDAWEDIDSPTTESFTDREEYTSGSSNALCISPSRLPSRPVRRRKVVSGQYVRPIYVATPTIPPTYAYKTGNGRERLPPTEYRSSSPMTKHRSVSSQSSYDANYHYPGTMHPQEPSWQRRIASFVLFWTGGLLSSTLGRILTPLSMLFGFYVIFLISIRAAVPMMRTAVAPLCVFPLMERTGICPTNVHSNTGLSQVPKWADYPSLVSVQNPTFEKLLESSTDSSALALEIKKTEMATADLAIMVDMSELTSKRLLSESLRDFIQETKKTGRQLHKLHSQVGGAVDQIMAVNDFALSSLEAASKRDALESSFSKAVRVVTGSGPKVSDSLVVDRFIDSMNVMADTLSSLIQAFQGTMSSLEELEVRLDTIETIIARENLSIQDAHADLLAELWTILGGNRKKRKHFEDHLHLLREIRNYRKRALVHVGGALQTLFGMSEDVEVLRQKVAASPEVVGPGGKERGIPIEVHVASIQNGLKRLEEGRKSARRREEEMIGRIFGNLDEQGSRPQVQRINSSQM